MRNIVLAILAAALAAPAPFALAAEGQGDNNAGKQPTMAELASKVDSLGTRLGSLASTVGTLRTELGALATTVGTLSSTVSANHTTIVGKFAPQMAVVMTVPRATSGAGNATYYLVGASTIPGFPAGTVAANGQIPTINYAGGRNQSVLLPAGTYLIELQQPYGDNAICQRSVSRRHGIANAGSRREAGACPRLFATFWRDGSGHSTEWPRLNDGFGIYTFTAPTTLRAQHRFPTGFVATDDKPLASYSGAFKITKLK